MTTKARVSFCVGVVGVLLSGPPVWAQAADEAFLKTLPAEEQSLKDTVDHWGLAFSDQLRRFLAARAAFREALGAQAPKSFIVGTQDGLVKIPKNKYWFKGSYGVSVAWEAARNESESVQIAVLPLWLAWKYQTPGQSIRGNRSDSLGYFGSSGRETRNGPAGRPDALLHATGDLSGSRHHPSQVSTESALMP